MFRSAAARTRASLASSAPTTADSGNLAPTNR